MSLSLLSFQSSLHLPQLLFLLRRHVGELLAQYCNKINRARNDLLLVLLVLKMDFSNLILMKLGFEFSVQFHFF